MSDENTPQDPSEESGHDAAPSVRDDTGKEGDRNEDLTGALESTLDDLNRSIERMEAIIGQLEAGEADWDESVRLISEANELAMSSSQKLDRVVQDVVYGSPGEDSGEEDEGEDRQESLDLP